jgi:hypothetical protein
MINKIKQWRKRRQEYHNYVRNLQWLSWELYESGWCKDMEKPKFAKPTSASWSIRSFPDDKSSPDNDREQD